MADTKTTGLTANTAPALTDIMYLVDDPGGSAASQKITLQNLRRQLFPYGVCGGRLTLTTATPVTTADASAAATLYYTPYKSGQIGLYDGSAGWDVLDFTELSLNIAAYTASKPYDIWAYNNSGAAALDSTVWTDATTRATALTYQNGILVKTGATTRRYLGTIYVNSSGGQTDDSAVKRCVWNYYNRVLRRMYDSDATGHTYTTAAWRSWNNDATIRLEFLVGVAEDVNDISIAGSLLGAAGLDSIGFDSTSANLDNALNLVNANAATEKGGISYKHQPAAGYHYYQAIQYGATTTTFGNVYIQAGIMA